MNAEESVMTVGDMPIVGGGHLPLLQFTRQLQKRTGRTVWRLKRQVWVNGVYHWKTVATRYTKQELDRIVDRMIVGRIMADVTEDGRIMTPGQRFEKWGATSEEDLVMSFVTVHKPSLNRKGA